jgi:hypothetical protein
MGDHMRQIVHIVETCGIPLPLRFRKISANTGELLSQPAG